MSAFYVLCCRPEHFRVVTGDNAHQEVGFQKWSQDPDHWHGRLLKTWDSVAAELGKRGAALIQVPPQAGLPDQCFAADSVVFVRDRGGRERMVFSNMNSANRQGEVGVMKDTLTRYFPHSPKLEIPDRKSEGTGDFLYLHGHRFFVQGYGPRSESGIGQTLARAVNQLVVEVPLEVGATVHASGLASRNTKGYHIDTLIMPLPGKHVIACFEAMHPATRHFFEKLYPKTKRIDVTAAEADLFVTNGLAVPKSFADKRPRDWTLFLPETTPKAMLGKVRQWGFDYKLFDFEPSTLTGGALHCMFNFNLKIHETPIAILPTGKPKGYSQLPSDRQHVKAATHIRQSQTDIRYYHPHKPRAASQAAEYAFA